MWNSLNVHVPWEFNCVLFVSLFFCIIIPCVEYHIPTICIECHVSHTKQRHSRLIHPQEVLKHSPNAMAFHHPTQRKIFMMIAANRRHQQQHHVGPAAATEKPNISVSIWQNIRWRRTTRSRWPPQRHLRATSTTIRRTIPFNRLW